MLSGNAEGRGNALQLVGLWFGSTIFDLDQPTACHLGALRHLHLQQVPFESTEPYAGQLHAQLADPVSPRITQQVRCQPQGILAIRYGPSERVHRPVTRVTGRH